MTDPQPTPWWRGPRFDDWFADAVFAEIARLRRRAGGKRHVFGDPTMDEDGLGLDSLDRLRLSAALAGLVGGGKAPADRFERLATWGQWLEEARRLAAASDTLGFRTSGSTGRPKLVRHPLAVLVEEVDESAAAFAPRRIVSLVPAHHLYGFLFGVLLPSRLGIAAEDGRSTSLTGLLREATPGTLFVAAPTHVAALVDTGATLGPEITLVASGGPFAADDHRAALALGFARVTEIYGSTETGGVGRRDDPAAPFRLFDRWRRGADETIVAVADDTRRLRLPDVAIFRDARDFDLGERRDAAATIGGTTVHPTSIARVLTSHPFVAAAFVRPMRPEEGDRLKAFVIPTAAAPMPREFAASLDRFVTERLSPPERPRAWTFGPRPPLDDRGKIVDWPIEPDAA
ncbi:MAG: AMP-binding protein [Phyllobacteriaceae bacterium]|nr:AMP-binding protein [Phyllobacteriaceae bacterium]